MNKKEIINKKFVDHTKQPLFFGEGLNMQRYDKFRYPQINAFYKKQEQVFWRPEEVDITRDVADYKKLSDHEKFVFTKNLGYQILLDSIQSRGINNIVEHCSNNEVEAYCSIWQFMETVHSRSYSHIIDTIYSDSSAIHDSVMEDEEIMKRASSVTHYYDELINSIPEETLEDKKKKLLLTLVSINILEGIRFYVSFSCSYAFAQRGVMEGNAKIIGLINRDENLHLGFTQTLLSILRDNKDEGFQDIYNDNIELIRQMYLDAAKEEMAWADYLFENGSLMGLNAEILKGYVQYITNKRMKDIKLEPVFDKIKNPIPWVNDHINSKSVQVAPQETEISSYVNSSDKSIKSDDWDF